MVVWAARDTMFQAYDRRRTSYGCGTKRKYRDEAHQSGGWSDLTFKSYDQGVESFAGTEMELIWLDEEPPLAIYTECLMRTMTTDGRIMATFTPLQGLSDVVLSFLPGGKVEEGIVQEEIRTIN